MSNPAAGLAEYEANQQIREALKAAVARTLYEKPPDALGRIVQLLQETVDRRKNAAILIRTCLNARNRSSQTL